jgi:hypothetical protein
MQPNQDMDTKALAALKAARGELLDRLAAGEVVADRLDEVEDQIERAERNVRRQAERVVATAARQAERELATAAEQEAQRECAGAGGSQGDVRRDAVAAAARSHRG